MQYLVQTVAFLTFEYGLTKGDLKRSGITTFSIDAWTDASGRPLRYAITAHGANETVNIVDTFSDCNQPLTITAP
jgi:hypothetical protein